MSRAASMSHAAADRADAPGVVSFGSRQQNGDRALRVAYVMSRFPKLTETFVLYEMLAVERLGAQVDIYPLLREPSDLVHPEAAPLVARAHYQPFLSWPIVRANWRRLVGRPRAYMGALTTLVRSTWGNWNFLVGGLVTFPKTVHAAERMQADGVRHVHAHFANHPAAAAFVIHRLTGIPYSFTAHGSDLHRDQRMLREKVEAASFVAAISAYNRDMILERCGEEAGPKVEVVHCGVDCAVFRPAAVPREPNTGLAVVCTGSLLEVKGQTYLIEAMRLLRERGIDASCLLIGEGPDRPALEQQILQTGLGDRARLAGARTRPEIADLLRQSDVAVTPSVPLSNGDREGIPVALMEAMATGLPVVASGISGIPELVEDGRDGLLVPPRDAAAIADALERLYRDGVLRRALGVAAREKVVARFDIEANAGRILDLCARSAAELRRDPVPAGVR